MNLIPVQTCQRCGNELSYRERQALAWYCTPCRKVREDAELAKQRGEMLNKANRKVHA